MQNWKYKMQSRTYTAVILILLLGSGLFAQAQEGRVYVSNNPYGAGISVRWAGEEISYQEGIRIYRRSGRKDWELLTAQPIMPPTSIPTDLGLSSNEQGMLQTFLDIDHQEFKDGFAGILMFMESLKSYRLAQALRITYDDVTAAKGKKYQYKVESSLQGKNILLGESEEIKCEDFSPLPSPQSITFERRKKRSFIWWDNDEDHYYTYNIYFKGPSDADFQLHTKELGAAIIEDKKDKFVEFNTHKDSAYTFKVEALDYFGQKAVVSEEIEIEIKDLDPPVPPVLLLKADAKDALITVSWTPGTDDDLAGYNLYRQLADEDSLFEKVNRRLLAPSDTVYQDRVGKAGVYNYELECIDEAGNAARSLPDFIEVKDIIPPPIPQYVDLQADTGKFVIRWQHVKADDLKGYVVMRSLADENNEDNIYMPASEIITKGRFEEEIPANMRTPYVYIVRSVDSLLNYSPNSEAVVGQLPDVTPPVQPFIKEVKEVEEGLRIVWMENAEKDLKGYNLYKRMEGDTTDYQKLNGLMVPRDIAAYTDKETIRGIAYEYQVEAVDYADLISPRSNTAKGQMENLSLAGEIAISKQKFNATKGEFNLAWNGSSLVNEPIIGYAIFRSQNGGKALQRGKVTEKTQFKEKLSQPGSYQYHIRVYGERGNILHSEPVQIEVETE